jgi:hypothetical protein
VQIQNYGKTGIHIKDAGSMKFSSVNVQGPPDYNLIDNHTSTIVGLILENANGCHFSSASFKEDEPPNASSEAIYSGISLTHGVVIAGTSTENIVSCSISPTRDNQPVVTASGGSLVNNHVYVNAVRHYIANQPVQNPIVKDANGNTVLAVGAGNANATDYVQIVNNIGSPYIQVAGSTANSGFSIITKGSGEFSVFSPTGQTPTLSAIGADAAHDLNLKAKGSGVVKIAGVAAASASNTISFSNKTISGADNTLSNIAQSSVTNLTTDLGAKLDKSSTPGILYGVDGSGAQTIYGHSVSASAFTMVQRDGGGSVLAGNLLASRTSTATAAGTTTLTVSSSHTQVFTGSTTQTVLLPTTSVLAGYEWKIINQSSGNVTIQSSGGNTVATMTGGTTDVKVCVALKDTPTAAADWRAI